MKPGLLKLLVCPETHQKLFEADAELVTSLNRRIGRGAVRNRGGQLVTELLEQALVREDRTVVYPIRDGLPMMLIDEAIPLD